MDFAPSPERADVVLVVPPVLHPGMPPLGAHLLRPSCEAAGLSTRVVEANLDFAGRVGFQQCGLVAASPPHRLLGEALFMAAAFPERADEHRDVLNRLNVAEGPGTVAMRWQAEPPSDALIDKCLAEIPGFIADTARTIVDCGAKIVGFSSMGQQTVASIALAREIKRLRPEIVTVIGGSNATAPMGAGILESTDAIDYAFSGEADVEFPKFCREVIREGHLPAERVIECLPISDMNSLPEPDYDAYFEALEPLKDKDPLARDVPDSLLFESSRGCWWGDKHLCKFCGYIPPAVGRYRMRSPEKIADAIAKLVERYGVKKIRASDAIMPTGFARDVLPLVIERSVDCTLAYEVKSNHRERDLDMYVLSGINELQPGIESLSSHVLDLMDKGVSAIDNVRLLRNAQSRGIHIIWNYLTGIPGESREDYEAMATLIPLIEHLNAPVRYGPIHVSRYSPYHQDPAQYGIENLRPMPVYAELFGERVAMEVCSNFDADYATEAMSDAGLIARFEATVDRWCDAWQRPEGPSTLEIHDLDGGWGLVHDSREVASAKWQVLDPSLMATLAAVRDPRKLENMPVEHQQGLEQLLERKVVISYEGYVMSVVTEPNLGLQLLEERKKKSKKRVLPRLKLLA
jgi:ribosomal peptide maturation radical SAM protein 1